MGDVKTGHLNQQITIIQESTTTRDASGAVIPAKVTLGPIYAAVEFKTVGSDESEIANQNTSVTNVNFTIRNAPTRTITAKDQVVYRGFTYEIRSVLEADPKRCFLILDTEQMGLNQTD